MTKQVAVITPYHTETPDMLARAMDSVAAQTHPCLHYLIADGHPSPEIEIKAAENSDTIRHIVLPREHANNGNTPRAIGCFSAMAEGADAIAFLDADNWYDPGHVASLLAEHDASGADVLTSGRVIHALDGKVLPVKEEDEGSRFFDTSTIMVTVGGFGVLPLWGVMPRELGPNCERFMFHAFRAHGCTHSHVSTPTLHFTSRYGPHYRAAGVPVPSAATAMHGMKRSTDFLRRLPPEAIKYMISARHYAAFLAERARTPLIVLATPGTEGLAEAFSQHADVEVHTCATRDILDKRLFLQSHANVFALLTDTDPEAEKITTEALWILPIVLRNPEGDVDTVLDRQAWRLIVSNPGLPERYHQENRFGAGHVMVGDGDLSATIDLLQTHMLEEKL